MVKQSLSHRVVDDQMPESRFTAAERSDLMTLGENIVSAPGEVIRFVDEVLMRGPHPDTVLSEVVRKYSDSIVSIEDHESILRDIEEEHLTEEEQKQADEDYQRELAAEHARQLSTPSGNSSNLVVNVSGNPNLFQPTAIPSVASVELPLRQQFDNEANATEFNPI